VDHSSPLVDLHPKAVGLIWRLWAIWCSVCIRQVNRVNSHNGVAMISAPQTMTLVLCFRHLTLKWNEVQSVQRLHSTRSDQRHDNPSGMARGLHNFTCHPHVYPRMEWAILHSLRKHSPDGVAPASWRTSGSAYYLSIDLESMKGWVGLVGWPIVNVLST